MNQTHTEKQSVLEILQNLNSLDGLKKLFWERLSFERENRTLDASKWAEGNKKGLDGNPILFASAGEDKGFHIIYCKLNSEKLLRSYERPIITQLLKEHPFSLIVFSNRDINAWHFINVKYETELSKRQVIRRIAVGVRERMRTAAERLELLDLDKIQQDIFGISLLAIQHLCDLAFDVEKVTEQFYKSFADYYEILKDELAKQPDIAQDAGNLAQLILNRLVFLYFIQKKGWMNGEIDYLYKRFRNKYNEDKKGYSFYVEILLPLFQVLSNKNSKFEHLGSVPFLNGGLFDDTSLSNPQDAYKQNKIKVSNQIFYHIFEDLLEKYNFTITEDTPFDVEVAIDPEMLGHIFENLVLKRELNPKVDLRKATGSYYTPKAIVHYMCVESLYNYLINITEDWEVADISDIKITIKSLVDSPSADQLEAEELKRLRDSFTDSHISSLNQALYDCKVCDPAVGSGAFLLGMLHELVRVIGIIEAVMKGSEYVNSSNYNYKLKESIILNCLYGVDIQVQAVKLCELRLWLSLIVDYDINAKVDNYKESIQGIPSLPNLSYRVAHGDSLVERLFGNIVKIDIIAKDKKTKQIIDRIQELKTKFFYESDSINKRIIELKIISEQITLLENLIEHQMVVLKESEYQDTLFSEDLKHAKDRNAYTKYIDLLNDYNHMIEKLSVVKSRYNSFVDTQKTPSAYDLAHLKKDVFQNVTYPDFIWMLDFAEVFAGKGGFDIVIANPPYIGEKGHKDLFSVIKEGCLGKFYQGKMDIYHFFFHLSINIALHNGIIAFITTNYYATATGGFKLRRDFHERTTILKLINFNELKIFESALGHHDMITVLKKGVKKDVVAKTCITKREGLANHEILSSIVNGSDEQTNYMQNEQKDIYDRDELYIRFYQSSSNESKSNIDIVLNKMKDNGVSLTHVCNVNTGIMGGCDYINNKNMRYCPENLVIKNDIQLDDGVFVLDRNNIRDNDVINKLKGSKYLVPFYKNSDIYRYCTRAITTKSMIFTSSDYSEDKTGIIEQHLLKFKPILTEIRMINNENTSYYKYLRRGTAHPQIFTNPKIIAPQRSPKNTFGYNEIHWYASADVYFITKKDKTILLKYVLALLNSKLFYVWLYYKGKRKGEMLELYQKPLSEIPIKVIGFVEQDVFVKYVNEIIHRKKQDENADISDLEDKINRLVYKLYGLTSEEISLVENFK